LDHDAEEFTPTDEILAIALANEAAAGIEGPPLRGTLELEGNGCGR
jgi:hypothetical protein